MMIKKISFICFFSAAMLLTGCSQEKQSFDVCVYGGTASGVMAAVAAKKAGHTVVIIEQSKWLGGMVGGGIQVNQDTRHPGDIGGLTRMMMKKDIEIDGGPHENQPAFRKAFRELVEEKGIRVIYEHRLGSVVKSGNRIETLMLDYAPPEADGCPIPEAITRNARQVSAKVFIDAGYEGDLMAEAGVSYVIGREARIEFNESLAGQRKPRVFDISPYVVPDDPSSGLLPMIDTEPYEEGAASGHIMAYNFRLQWVPAGKGTPVGEPGQYDPEKYALLLRALEKDSGMIGWPSANYDRTSLFSGGIPGRQSDYPDGSWEERAEIWREWVDHVKIMHKLTGSGKNLQKGEYPESNDFPDQLYIRLGRRMRGLYVMTQHDLMLQTDVDDPVGLGYGWIGWTDIYPCRLIATEEGKVASEGEVHETVTPGPYKIPFRAIIPQKEECSNLIVPVCASSTHIAMSSIRMEATWMLMGESAGIAAALSIEEGVPVQDIDREQYRDKLLAAGQILEWDGTGYGGDENCWWHKHPEDYTRRPVSTLLKGPREPSDFVKMVEADQRGKKEWQHLLPQANSARDGINRKRP